MADTFDTNLLRLIASELYFSCQTTVAREMFGKSLFALGFEEKAAVLQATLAGVGSLYPTVTPELLAAKTLAPVGFQASGKTDATSGQPSATESPQSPPGRK
jgi:hypothetical protein